MKDVMLDLEAFGNGKNKCLSQIGAVYFDNVTGELGEKFFANVDVATHQAIGGEMDAQTVYWWLEQSDEARKSLLPNRISITEAFEQLNVFLSKATRVWSHATYDFVTIMETFKQLNMKPNIGFKNGLDIRTLVYLSGISINSMTREGIHHNALADCEHQIKYCIEALKVVKTNKKLIATLESLTN